MNRFGILTVGIASVAGLTWVWHGPLGAAERFTAKAETAARSQLDHDEMIRVQAKFERNPLTRKIILSGPADDFQRAEIKRRMELIPGVGEASWSPESLDMEAAQ